MKNKKSQVITSIVVLIAVAIVLSMGSVSADISEDVLKVSATLSARSEISLEDITDVKLLDSLESGRRSFGVETMKIMGGTFTNNQFGKYKLYCYKKINKYIVVYSTDKIVCFNLDSEEETENFYNEIIHSIS